MLETAYFDTNGYNYIAKGWLGPERTERLYKAIDQGHLQIAYSLHNMEEMLFEKRWTEEGLIKLLRTLHNGDSRDVHHAVSGVICNYLVSDDANFVRRIARVDEKMPEIVFIRKIEKTTFGQKFLLNKHA